MGTLIMYSIPGCGTCARARRELVEEGVEFEERDINTNPEWFDEASRLGVTVPIFVRDGRVDIGWKGDTGCLFQ